MSEKKLKTEKSPKPIKLYLPAVLDSMRAYELAILSSLLALRVAAETGAEIWVNGDEARKRQLNLKYGICQNLVGLCEASDWDYRNVPSTSAFLAEIMRQWPKHSGNYTYPIKVERFSELSADEQFWGILYNNQKFSKELIKEYLALRLELLDFCIEYLRTKLGLPG